MVFKTIKISVKTLFAVIIFFYSTPSSAQKKYIINYNLLGIDEGLSVKQTFCGVQDDKGFAWFATANGLNRYDGRKIQIFNTRNSSLRTDNMIRLATDMNNHLFILNGQSGYTGYERLPDSKVDVLDETTMEIMPIDKVFKDLPFKEADVFWITNDESGTVNFLTSDPFSFWQYSSGKGFTLKMRMKGWSETLYEFVIPTGPHQFLYKDVALLGVDSHEVQYLLNKKNVLTLPQFKDGREVICMFNGRDKFLLQRSDYNLNNISYYTIAINGAINTHATISNDHLKIISTNGTVPISIENDTTCLFNVPGRGLFWYTGNSLVQVIDAKDIKEYSNINFYQSFKDRVGNIWVCSSGGIFKIKIRENKFTHFFSRDQQQVTPKNQARGIWVDKQGTIYANMWAHLFLQKGDKQLAVPSSDGEMQYALIPHNNKLYATSIVVMEYDQQKNKLVTKGANTGRSILSGISLNDSILLLGKMEKLYSFNTNTLRSERIDSNARNFEAKFMNIPYRFLKRKDGTIWVLGETQLFLLNRKGEITDYYDRNSKQKTHQLPPNNYSDIFEDDKGMIWLATNGNGLCKWDRKQNKFWQFDRDQGFPSTVLYRIEEDDLHNLWISTENGLVLFDPKKETVNTFSVKDGLSDNEFNKLSSYKANDGRMFFGGINGVNAFYPDDIINDTIAANVPLRIISFQQYKRGDEKLMDKTLDILRQKKIVLEPGDRFFNIEFRLLDFENKINRYAYKIVGQDKDWVYTTENNIRISGLPYGNYTLLIKGQNITGQWSRSELSIPVEVIAPFYMKWWVQLLFLLIIVIGIVFFFRYRTNQLTRAKKQLEEVVDSRTTELKKSLSERELLLKEIHHRVKNNLQIISGLLDLQKEEIEAEESKAVFNEGQSRVKSIALIHQNLYQNEDLANVKFYTFVKELCVQVGEVFEQFNSRMQVNVNMPELFLDIDTAVPLGLIINELLTNAFKYATSKTKAGIVDIRLTDNKDGSYVLTFSDNGPGIQQEIDFSVASTLGLRLVRGLSAQLYGDANYHFDNGSVFTITFKDSKTRRAED